MSVARSQIVPTRHRTAIGVYVLPEQRDLAHTLRDERLDLGYDLAERAAHFLAARVGHDAEAAVPAAAFHDRHEGRRARPRAVRAGGRISRFPGMTRRPAAGRLRAMPRSSPGRRWIVCGPNTRSTNGARSRMPSPSWLATQPPTPITRPGLLIFSSRHWPSCEKTFSWAFSRTEQVFSRTTSACFGSVGRAPDRPTRAGRRPCAPSRIRSSGSRRSKCRAGRSCTAGDARIEKRAPRVTVLGPPMKRHGAAASAPDII